MKTYIDLNDNNTVRNVIRSAGTVETEGRIVLEGRQFVTGLAYFTEDKEFYTPKRDEETNIILLNGNGKAIEDLTAPRIKPKQLGD